MFKLIESGYVQLNPDLNDSYDMETGEEIYVPSNYPFDVPKVYITGCCDSDGCDIDSIITVRDNILTQYSHYDYYDETYDIMEYNLDTLEVKEYKVTLGSTSRMGMRDYYRLLDYIDPNLIKKISNNEDTISN